MGIHIIYVHTSVHIHTLTHTSSIHNAVQEMLTKRWSVSQWDQWFLQPLQTRGWLRGSWAIYTCTDWQCCMHATVRQVTRLIKRTYILQGLKAGHYVGIMMYSKFQCYVYLIHCKSTLPLPPKQAICLRSTVGVSGLHSHQTPLCVVAPGCCDCSLLLLTHETDRPKGAPECDDRLVLPVKSHIVQCARH